MVPPAPAPAPRLSKCLGLKGDIPVLHFLARSLGGPDFAKARLHLLHVLHGGLAHALTAKLTRKCLGALLQVSRCLLEILFTIRVPRELAPLLPLLT